MKNINVIVRPARAAAVGLALALQACSTGSVAATPAQAVFSSMAPASTDSLASSGRADAVKLSALPLDDYRYSTGPKTGWVFTCAQSFGGPGAPTNGPWVNAAANTFDLLKKPAVEGSVSWHSVLSSKVAGGSRDIAGNGLPSHPTGIYPISASDPVYKYDRNPNSIEAQNLHDMLPANPVVAKTPSCANMGAIGVMLTGAQIYNALDAQGRDAVAHEVLDKCSGHPDQSGTYHYHSVSACMHDPGTGHSNLLGYALDGFGIYGLRGTSGKALTDADLDACHGHTHDIVWNGKTVRMYHYHFTNEYPYSIGCYRGIPIAASFPP
jgi:hypothetical protein